MASKADRPWPRKEESQKYLQSHKVLELFDNMTSQLIYHRPDNPKEFLAEQLEKLQTSKQTKVNHPCLFNESNTASIFGMLDPTGRGYITTHQYREALQTLGIKDYQAHPPGHDVDKISLDTFQREAKLGLGRASSTFIEKK